MANDSELSLSLPDFLSEIKKKNDQEYPSASMYLIYCGLNRARLNFNASFTSLFDIKATEFTMKIGLNGQALSFVGA